MQPDPIAIGWEIWLDVHISPIIAKWMTEYTMLQVNKLNKTITKILSGSSDNNIEFSELVNLLKFLGFSERIKGSHHIFFKENIEEIINIQSKGNKAKPYQVKQVRQLITKYKLIKND